MNPMKRRRTRKAWSNFGWGVENRCLEVNDLQWREGEAVYNLMLSVKGITEPQRVGDKAIEGEGKAGEAGRTLCGIEALPF